MNTALITAGAVTVRPQPTRLQRLLRSIRAAFVAADPAAGSRYSRDELAQLHERRREADRLREERFHGTTLSRIL